ARVSWPKPASREATRARLISSAPMRIAARDRAGGDVFAMTSGNAVVAPLLDHWRCGPAGGRGLRIVTILRLRRDSSHSWPLSSRVVLADLTSPAAATAIATLA